MITFDFLFGFWVCLSVCLVFEGRIGLVVFEGICFCISAFCIWVCLIWFFGLMMNAVERS